MWVSKEIKSIWSIVSLFLRKQMGSAPWTTLSGKGTDGSLLGEEKEIDMGRREQEIMQAGREAVAHEGGGVDPP